MSAKIEIWSSVVGGEISNSVCGIGAHDQLQTAIALLRKLWRDQ